MPQISPEAAKQIKEDERLHAPTERKTGSLSGSIRSRKTEEKYPRYPESFAIELEAVEAESGPHLEAIKKHFSEELGTAFLGFFGRPNIVIFCSTLCFGDFLFSY